MSHLFKLRSIMLILAVVLITEMLVLGHIYAETHAGTRREARMVGQLLQQPIQRLDGTPQHDADVDYSAAFSLHNLSALQKLDIQFIREDGHILDSNHLEPGPGTMLPRLLVWLVDKHLGLMTMTYPVSVAGQQIGNIVIRNNLLQELEE